MCCLLYVYMDSSSSGASHVLQQCNSLSSEDNWIKHELHIWRVSLNGHSLSQLVGARINNFSLVYLTIRYKLTGEKKIQFVEKVS